jgi:probable addiction module antidote protein
MVVEYEITDPVGFRAYIKRADAIHSSRIFLARHAKGTSLSGEEAPDDAAGIARALGDIARARGMTQVARDAGLSRESLYKALGKDGNPSFATILKVARAVGVRLHALAA